LCRGSTAEDEEARTVVDRMESIEWGEVDVKGWALDEDLVIGEG
jgi:hypothetical protein